MTLKYKPAKPIFQGQNIRPPLGSWFNGQSYWLKLFPELGNDDRTVLVIKMILQFQFEDSDDDDKKWKQSEKESFAHKFVDGVIAVWNERFRITTDSKIPAKNCRDVGVVFEFPYYIDGWHTDDDFEISVKKIDTPGKFEHSRCNYSLGNTYLHSESVKAWNKGASMKQRPSVHEFGHMLGLRDEYTSADDNPHHTGDLDSIMNKGEIVRERHYAPFAAWLSEKYKEAARLAGKPVNYKVNGKTDMSNARL